MTEIRSFRRVFDLERRIYSIDRLRLNPAGVPVRGVVYLLIVLAAVIATSRMPVIGQFLRAIPWYVRELGLPTVLAAFLAVIRVDGRTFHLAAGALGRLLTTPRRVSALHRASSVGARWRPACLVLLPDGSDHRLRALRFKGPGAVLVTAPHERIGALERHGVGLAQRQALRIRPSSTGTGQTPRRVIYLESGVSLTVIAAPPGKAT